jgi:tetratricopeptide (TPR) repeat protein
LAELLNVSRDRLKSWLRNGLIRPTQTVDGLDYFDYAQVVGVKTLVELTSAGVKVDGIRRSLQLLHQWLPNIDDPLAQLTILEQAGEVRVRYKEDLVDPSGQKVFEFDEPVSSTSISMSANKERDWFAVACELEDAGRLAEAADAYRQALLVNGADRDTTFNLANVLHSLNQKTGALEWYYQVLELDKTFVQAWVNIGVILSEEKRHDEAQRAFQTALGLDRDCLEARYNIADLLQSTGKHEEAQEHWSEYLKRDSQSQWGRFARKQLQRG